MTPGENPLGPFRAEKFPTDQEPEDLAGEELRQPIEREEAPQPLGEGEDDPTSIRLA